MGMLAVFMSGMFVGLPVEKLALLEEGLSLLARKLEPGYTSAIILRMSSTYSRELLSRGTLFWPPSLPLRFIQL